MMLSSSLPVRVFLPGRGVGAYFGMQNNGIHSMVLVLLACLVAGCTGRAMHPDHSPVEPVPATVSVTETGHTFRIPAGFFGFNTQLMRGPAWREPGFTDQVKKLRPSLLRYPGGTVASYWNWRTGTIDTTLAIRNAWRNIREAVPVKLEDLKFACDATGAVPLFVLNMVHRTLEDQTAMLLQAQKIGLPVRYLELDNEVYLGDEVYTSRFENGLEYAKSANRWIAALKQQFPGVQIGVVGYASREGGAARDKPHITRMQNWNRQVLGEISNADALTLHVYGGTGLNFLRSISGDDDSKASEQLEKFNDPHAMQYVLTAPMLRWAMTEAYDYKILPEGMEAWITEYNLFEREGVVAGTWAHGLYTLLLTLGFMNDPRTGRICYHNLSTSAQFAAVFNTADGFAKAVVQKPTTRLGLTASGYTLSMFGASVRDAAESRQLRFDGCGTVSGARGKAFEALQGWRFIRPGGNSILVVNLSSQPYRCEFGNLVVPGSSYSQLSADPKVQVAAPGDLKQTSGKGVPAELPPYSVTCIATGS